MSYVTKWNVERLQALCYIALKEGNITLYRFYRELIVKWLGI